MDLNKYFPHAIWSITMISKPNNSEVVYLESNFQILLWMQFFSRELNLKNHAMNT